MGSAWALALVLTVLVAGSNISTSPSSRGRIRSGSKVQGVAGGPVSLLSACFGSHLASNLDEQCAIRAACFAYLAACSPVVVCLETCQNKNFGIS